MRLKSACSSYWFIFQNGQLIFIKENEKFNIPTDASVNELKPLFVRQILLGQFQKTAVFAAEIPEQTSLPEAMQSIPLRKAFEYLDPNWYSMVARALSIMNWDQNHQYCGRCGNKTMHESQSFERKCTICSATFYPRISPSIIVLIKKGNQILMARSPHFKPGAYGLIAGFIEAGENVEEALHREVKEETGLEIKNIRYFGSQSWPFPDSLLLAFTADYAGGELTIDPTELEAADWYDANHLPGYPSSSVSISRKLIDHFVAEQKGVNDGTL